MDLELVGGVFLDDKSIPKNKDYLLKYFSSEPQKRFLLYYIVFGDLKDQNPGRFYKNFTDHTGIYCDKRVIQKWIKKIKDLEYALQAAMSNMDVELVSNIRLGKYRLSKKCIQKNKR